jgi:hypothetical protein
VVLLHVNVNSNIWQDDRKFDFFYVFEIEYLLAEML